MGKKSHRTRQQQPRPQHRQWVWLATSGVTLLVLLGIAGLLTRPVGTSDQVAADIQVGDAHTFFSPGWHDCPPFVEEVLRPALGSRASAKLAVHDFNIQRDMQLLLSMAEKTGLPRSFDSYMFTFVQREETLVVLLGHPPQGLIQQALRQRGLPEKLVINQEEMHDYVNAENYDLWPFEGEIKRYDMSVPLGEALRQAGALRPDAAREPLPQASMPLPEAVNKPKDVSPVVLPAVLGAGLIDGINPCAFAVMAFFTALLFALRRSRQQVLLMGITYMVGMYLTYFGIGLGLLRTLTLLGQPHLITQLGGVAVVLLGLIQVKDGLFPGLPLHLTMPRPGWELIQSWAKRANLPAAFVVGGLVGLCTLPCSGGIYVAILGLLTSQTSYASGLGYLALYNIMFILPLAAILLFVSSRPVSLALANWERKNTHRVHLLIGAVMVGLGGFMLLWLS